MFLGGSPSAGQVSGVVALLNLETSEQIERLLSSRESGASPIIGVSRLLSHEQIYDSIKDGVSHRYGLTVGS